MRPATDSSEFGLIDRFFRPLQIPELAGERVRLGIGDDAALIDLPDDELLVTSVDTQLAGVHYPADAAPDDIGYRALAVAASDLAAMGAAPLACTLALTLPQADPRWIRGFSAGLRIALADYRLPLVGGDTTRGPIFAVTVQVLGSVPEGLALRRDGASPGDGVYVSGCLGDAAAALAAQRGEWQPGAVVDYLHQRFYRPTPRLELGESLRGLATAAIDVSDGLLADLGHVCADSGVAMALASQALPLSAGLRGNARAHAWALGGGDDYELAFTLPDGCAVPAVATRIGVVEAGEGIRVDGERVDARGYQHF